jgi:hypothetical protein
VPKCLSEASNLLNGRRHLHNMAADKAGRAELVQHEAGLGQRQLDLVCSMQLQNRTLYDPRDHYQLAAPNAVNAARASPQ